MKPKILLVEDYPDCIDMLSYYLLRTGNYQVIEAFKGREAIEAAEREQPDLILLDLRLPDMSGYEVMAALDRQPETKHIPVLVCTAWSHESFKNKAIRAGAKAFLTKPTSTAVLKKSIDEILEGELVHSH